MRAVHHPVWVISWGFRKELMNSPAGEKLKKEYEKQKAAAGK